MQTNSNSYRMAERSNFAQTCNLLSQYLKEKRSLYLQGGGAPATTTMNLLNNMEPSQASSASVAGPVGQQVPDHQQPRSAAAPMTIFYGGQVLVFSDLSAEKAKEIMSFATKGSSVSIAEPMKTIVTQPQQPKPQPIESDLPIARRASLHKFLAKRKERVTAVSPYQVNYYQNQREGSSSKAEGQVLEGQSSKQLELRL